MNTDTISPSTHIILWHSSPVSIYPEIDANGIELYREYVWCSMGPWMPIGFAKKFTGDFILSCVALPRSGPQRYLWAETRGHPDGDNAEKTYDHGGGHYNEVKLWSRIPRQLILRFWTNDEVDAILSSGCGGYIGPGTKSRTEIDVWTPGVSDVKEICASLLVDSEAEREARLHAGVYLWTMGILNADEHTTIRRRTALMDMVMSMPVDWEGDKLAVACWLLSVIQPSWMHDYLERGESESIPEEIIARVFAFAFFSHTQEEIYMCLENGLCQGIIQVLVQNLFRIVESKGSDRQACKYLAALEGDGAEILVDVLLGLPFSNAVSNALIQVLGMMPDEVGTPALINLLRRRRDVSSKARGTINEVLATKLPHAEHTLLDLARIGHWYSRRAARQILLRHGSQNAIKQVENMLEYDNTENIDRRNRR